MQQQKRHVNRYVSIFSVEAFVVVINRQIYQRIGMLNNVCKKVENILKVFKR